MLATYCSCSKKDSQSYNRLSCDSPSPTGFWATSSVFPLWLVINSNGVVELALMVSSCVLARPILSSFCLSCLFGVLSKRSNRQQSPGLPISKTTSCWCVLCGLSLKPVSDNPKNRMGEKIKITTMHSGQLHSHHCFISFLRAKNCYTFFLLPETSLFPSFQVGKMLRRRFLEIFAMGRLQSNSSPDVPGLEVTFLLNFHTVSPVAWDGLVSEYEVGFQYLCIASQSTPRAFPFRGFHCVSYSVGGLILLQRCPMLGGVTVGSFQFQTFADTLPIWLPVHTNSLLFLTSLSLNGTEFFMCLPRRRILILSVWSLFWRTLSSFHTVRAPFLSRRTLCSRKLLRLHHGSVLVPKNWITESSHFTLRPKLSRRHSRISKISSQQLFIPFKICANVNVSSWFGYSTYLYVSFGPSRLFTLLPSWCRLWTWLPNVWQLGTLSLKLKYLKLPQQNSFSLRWSALRLTQKSILFRAPNDGRW